jgi:hypothetical protein
MDRRLPHFLIGDGRAIGRELLRLGASEQEPHACLGFLNEGEVLVAEPMTSNFLFTLLGWYRLQDFARE